MFYYRVTKKKKKIQLFDSYIHYIIVFRFLYLFFNLKKNPYVLLLYLVFSKRFFGGDRNEHELPVVNYR